MKWPVETIDAVVQVNPKLATAADRPDVNEIVCFVPMAAVSEETLSIEAQAERFRSPKLLRGTRRSSAVTSWSPRSSPCFENGKMALADNLAHELGFGTTEFHVFRPSERITGPYLFNLLRCAPYVRKAGAMKMKGAAGQRRVPADFFASAPNPPPAPRRAEADCGDSGCGGRLAGQAPRGPRPARHPPPIHLPRHVRRPRHQSHGVGGEIVWVTLAIGSPTGVFRRNHEYY